MLGKTNPKPNITAKVATFLLKEIRRVYPQPLGVTAEDYYGDGKYQNEKSVATKMLNTDSIINYVKGNKYFNSNRFNPKKLHELDMDVCFSSTAKGISMFKRKSKLSTYCPFPYLNCYSLFLGADDFSNLVNNLPEENAEEIKIKNEQQKLLKNYTITVESDLDNRIEDNPDLIIPFAGDYFVYYLIETEDRINKAIMRIEKSGKVLIKGSDKNANIEESKLPTIYIGTAHVMNLEILVVNIFRSDNMSWYIQYIIGAEAANVQLIDKQSNIFQGVRSTVDYDGRPICSRVVICKSPTNIFDTEDFDSIPIFPLKTINGEVHYVKEINDRFSKLNNIKYNIKGKHQTVPIGDFLRGRTDSIISGYFDDDRTFEKDMDYGKLYFAAACFYGMKEEKDKDNFLRHLHKARMHGFYDIAAILTIKEELWFKKLDIKDDEIIIIESPPFFYLPAIE